MPRRNWVSWLVAVLPIALGLFWVVLAFLPYGTLRTVTDSLMPDHNFNSLKSWNAGVFKVLFGASGLIFLGLAALTGLQRWNIIGYFFKQLWADARRFFAGLRPQKGELGFLAAVLVIMVLAVIYRLEHIYSSLHHDEAYTFVAFARSLFSAVTDYSLPNNHVFHSILVYFSTKIFGIQPWAVRLPALVAGVLLVPAAYWLAKRLYDRWTALAAAFLVAWFSPLIAYADNARGYTLIALFTLLTLALGDMVRKEKNLFAWALISLFSALGLFTVPVMLFPFGVLFVWLFLENQFAGVAVSSQPDGSRTYRARWEFLYYWLAAGFGTAVLTILLYVPILVYTGPQKLFANGFVAPLAWADLLETLSLRFAETWAEWTFRVPLAILLLFAAGWTLSLLFHWRLSGTRVPLQLAALLWIVILLLVQRPNAWSKAWVFLQPLMLLWAAAGIFGLLQKVRLKAVRGLSLAVIVFSVVLFAGIWQAVRLVPQLPELWAIKGEEEKSVLFVQSQLRDDDLIIVSSQVGAAVMYYAEVYGIPNTHFDRRNSTFERAWILVDLAENQTPASVIAERGPDQIILDIKSAHLLETFGNLQVFEIPRQ